MASSRWPAWAAAGILWMAGGSPARAGVGEDDLSVVRKAVAQATPVPDARAPRKVDPPRTERRPAKPLWLKVRVVERSGKGGRVSINVPLSLARAIGDDIPLDWDCHHSAHHGPHKVRLKEVLETLDSGQDIVQIEDEDASVRVWVE